MDKTHKKDTYSVPIINLTNQEISESILYHLRFGLNHSFVNKNRFVKLNIVAEFEQLLTKVSKAVPKDQLEHFKHFLRVYTNLFNQNLQGTRDFTYKVLHKLTSDPNISVLSGDKDSSVVIMERKIYVEKLEVLINEGIKNGKYAKAEDTTLQDLISFQTFLSRNFAKTLPLK